MFRGWSSLHLFDPEALEFAEGKLFQPAKNVECKLGAV
jgi:hypothetical protein